MSEKVCSFQKIVTETTGFFQESISLTVCGLTMAGTYADHFCLCDPDICPIYQIWKRETK